MKLNYYLIIFISLGWFKAYPQTQVQSEPEDLFQKGNSAYAEGNYTAAVEAYEQILESGQTAAEVHYNLANSHYKLGNIAPSIYHYEKAMQLDPNDKDIRNNLQLAQNMTIDAIEETPQDGFSRWWQSFLSSFSTTGWATVAIICMLIFVLLFLAYYFSRNSLIKRLYFVFGLLFAIFSLSSVGFGFLRADQLRSQIFAVVFAEEVGISSEPNSRGEDLFFLHEGTKVELLEDFQDWYKIELANGNQGWLPKETVKKL